ncbi:tyrosine-type recombinase/integrase [Saccharopolyspora hattusasensis]|uniref:tyrosine-type recombinase/integrase n=1 Tax=Saccharopolyspora hattusasensis TaxID=1128679 RepID=UPI003D95DE7E
MAYALGRKHRSTFGPQQHWWDIGLPCTDTRLPEPLLDQLKLHAVEQAAERERAGDLWHDGDWLVTNEVGQPLNHRTDLERWKDLLAAAGVRDARLHDARHTAATVLLELGVTQRATEHVMGWSNPSMAKRYMHVTGEVLGMVADKVGETSGRSRRSRPASAEKRPAETRFETRGNRAWRGRTRRALLALVRQRKWGDSNPRSLSRRSLSSCTAPSAVLAWQSAAYRRAQVAQSCALVLILLKRAVRSPSRPRRGAASRRASPPSRVGPQSSLRRLWRS